MDVTREIWLGPVLGRQREALIERCRALLREGRSQELLYLAASRSLMLDVYSRLIDGEDIRGTLGPLPLHLFNGFISQTLKSALVKDGDQWRPMPKRERIDVDARPLQRPLLAQVMARLSRENKIPHFGTLAVSNGCVASVADLIGEIQRAGKTAGDFSRIVEERIRRSEESKPEPGGSPERAPSATGNVYGYERDVALIGECYQQALHACELTEVNEDHLRTLEALTGEADGLPCRTPYIEPVTLLVVDGFYDFTPAQGEILKRLIARIPNVIFNFDYEELNPEVFNPIAETVEHVEGMGAEFQRVNFHDSVPTARHVEMVPMAEGLDRLRFALFNPDWIAPDAADVAMSETVGPVFLIEAPDTERELRKVAKLIKKHVAEDGFSPDDIAVVVREKSSYASEIRRVFGEEGIAFSLDERMPISDIPAVRAVRKLLDAAASRRESDRTGKTPHIPIGKIVGALKSDYFTIPGHDELTGDEIENVVAFVGGQLHLDDWVKRAARLLGKPESELESGPPPAVQLSLLEDSGLAEAAPDNLEEVSDGMDEDDVGRVRVRADAVEPRHIELAARALIAFGKVLLTIPFESDPVELGRGLFAALDTLGLESGLKRAVRAAQAESEKTLRATLDVRGCESLHRAVRAVQDAVAFAQRGIFGVFGEATTEAGTTLSLTEFRDEIGRSLEIVSLRVQPETFGAVRVLEVTDMRGLHFPVVFQLGMVEGTFPMRGKGDWIYPAAEREQLKEYGLTLEDISPATIRKEEHYFYQVACRATERLYLTRPDADSMETETVESYFLEEIRRAFPVRFGEDSPNILRSPKGYDGSFLPEASTARELVRAVAAAENRRERGEVVLFHESVVFDSDVLNDAEKVEILFKHSLRAEYLKPGTNRRLGIEKFRTGVEFTPFDGRVEADDLRIGLADRFGPARIFSATEMNEFGNCAYRFFAARVLRLRPRVTAALDLQNQDRGLLLHEILRDFFVKFGGVNGSPKRETLSERLKTAADGVFERFELKLPPLNPKLWDIEKSVLLLQLERLLDYEIDLEGSAASPLRQKHAELAFGMGGKNADRDSVAEPLILENPEGERLRLRGQIDRVDASGDGKLLAYDYKTSKGPSLTDMREGRDVQLAIYLEALEKLFTRDGEEVIGGGYYTLRGGSDRRNNGLYASDFSEYTGLKRTRSNLALDEWRATRRELIDIVWTYWRRMKDGDFRVAPSQGDQTCKFCDYRPVCRFDNFRIRRKLRRRGRDDAPKPLF
jgi:ATP-dependent helicase/DNAse subunit B